IAGGVVLGVSGGKAVTAATIRGPDGKMSRIGCDLVAMSGGFSPSVHLATYLGSKPVWNDGVAAFLPGTPPPGMAVAGAAAGSYGLADCLGAGARLGAEAAEQA